MTGTRRGTKRRLVREVALWIGAVLGVLSIVATVAALAFDVKPLVFRSGSMSPAIESGALALAREVPATQVEKGDVVSVIGADGVRVTHRVVAVGQVGGSVSLALQGDANATPDAEAYTVGSVDRVLWDVPHVGRVVAAAGSPIGTFVCGALVMLCLYLAFAPTRPRTQAGRRPAGRRRGTDARAVMAVLGGALLALPLAQPQGTLAYFTDSAPMSTGSISSHRVVSQAQPTCANVNGLLVLGNVARLSWTQVDAKYEYFWELRRTSDSVAVGSGEVGQGQALGSVVELNIGTGLIGVNANYDVVVRARLSSTNAWVAAATTTTPVRRDSILFIGAAFRCGHG
ncbi:signal peptidase I [Aeromicrobium sp. Sec7.5]|uniref:signal peptidase I n=1 Tax=Aeromicrobium sp. Sec7.5 TaxID=3121276 RepID=UPI002FE48CFE